MKDPARSFVEVEPHRVVSSCCAAPPMWVVVEEWTTTNRLASVTISGKGSVITPGGQSGGPEVVVSTEEWRCQACGDPLQLPFGMKQAASA